MDSALPTADLAQTLLPTPSYVPSSNHGGNGDAQPFAEFMTQNQTTAKPQVWDKSSGSFTAPKQAANTQSNSSNNTSSSNASSNVSVSASSAPGSFLPALKKLTTALHTLIQKLQPHQNAPAKSAASSQPAKEDKTKAAADGSDQTAAPTQTADATAPTQTPAPVATPTDDATQQDALNAAVTVTPPVVAAPAAPATTNTDPSVDATAKTKLGDLLTQLATLLRTIEKKLQLAGTPATTAPASGTAAGTAATPTTDDTTKTADATDTSDASQTGQTPTLTQMLVQLSTLTQQIAKRLEDMQAASDFNKETVAAAAGAQTPITDPTQADPTAQPASPLAALDIQVKEDLKTLLDALRTHTGPIAGKTDDSSKDDTKISASDLSARSVSSVDIISRAPNPLAIDTTTKAPAAKTAAPAQTASPAAANSDFSPAPAAAVTADGGRQGPKMDMGTGSQGQNNQTPSQGTGAISNINGANISALSDVQKSSPYSFASQLSATRATEGPTGLPSAVEQVILQMNRNVKNGNDQMTLQLNPGDLGRVDIKLTIAADGKVQGTVVAENPATLHALSKDVGSLERALQDAGLRADSGSLQFSLGDQPKNSGQTSGGSQSSGKNGNNVASGDANFADVASDQPEVWYVTPGRVNFKV